MTEGGIFASAEERRRVAVHLLLAACGLGSLAVLWVVTAPHPAWLSDPAAMADLIRGLGPLAPVGFVVVQAVQVVVAPIPGQVLALVSGYLFGGVWGTVYSMVGVTLGSFIAISLSRRYGRPYVERVLSPTVIDRFDDLVTDAALPGLFVLYLLPALPDDALCFLAGLTDIRIRVLIVVVAAARLPAYLAVNFAGSGLASAQYRNVALLLGGLALAALLVYWRRDAIVAVGRRFQTGP